MIPPACAAGNYAIGYGFDLIRSGRSDLMLAGGADPFSRITYMGFARLGAIAPVAITDASYLRNPEHRELLLSGLRLAMGETV